MIKKGKVRCRATDAWLRHKTAFGNGGMRKLEDLKEGYGWTPSQVLVCTEILNELKGADLSTICYANITRAPIHANAFWNV